MRRPVSAAALGALGAALLAVVACHAPAPARAAVGFDDFGPTAAVEVEAVVALPLKQDPQREQDRAARAVSRAFYTAPPVVPHEGASGASSAGCLECHADAGLLTPHPQFSNCMQCHLAGEVPFGEPATAPASAFVGLEPPRSVVPAAAETPPGIPHRLAMRERCIACHDPDGMYESLHTPHPERVNCRQCHLPLAGMEFGR